MEGKEITALVFDVDASIMPQGGPADYEVAGIFRVLSGLGIKIGPATGKNCDYARGLACGMGTIFDFVIGETGAQFLETVYKGSPPVFKQRKMLKDGCDLAAFAEKIGLDHYNRTFVINNKKESYRPELKEMMITLFPPGEDLEATNGWRNFFEEVIKELNLKLKVQRHHDGCIDIVPNQISKGLGIDQVCELYNCRRENILVVVDGINDVELMEGTNIIAVGNADDFIKKITKERNGFVATLPDGKGFIEGLAYFAKQKHFKGEINKKIIEAINGFD
jgi:HAD superfamily hydrolase (TIGR01484 family)